MTQKQIDNLIEALPDILRCVEYAHEHEGAPITLRTVKAALRAAMVNRYPPDLPVFRPDKRSMRDAGGKREMSNGANAICGDAMLNEVADRDALGEQDTLTDALTNLRHWAHRQRVDFEDAVNSSRNHWLAER